MKLILLFLFLMPFLCKSQTSTGYKYGDKALVNFLEKELSYLNEANLKHNTLIYTEVYFNKKGNIELVDFFNDSINNELKLDIRKILLKTKGNWLKRQYAVPLLIPIIFLDLNSVSGNSQITINYNELLRPYSGINKQLPAKKYIFLFPVSSVSYQHLKK